ncbi:MAG: SDR family oxidoreductase [Leptospirales bacterium]|nr:SDR family oxidoreductase [Leptospirales bacterium]HMZ37221.1 SDR family oxidoreductase [Leptospiraceae bacterium]
MIFRITSLSAVNHEKGVRMSLVALIKPKGPSGFGYGTTAEEVTQGLDLSGKNILVTGCNSGLGEETARVLAKRGARILGTARTVEKANAAVAPLGNASTGFECELSDPKSVRSCVDAIKKDGVKLDALICNAGIMALPELKQASGYELQFFTNHIGHFILVNGLLDQLKSNGRVVMLSSSAHANAPREGIQFDNLSGEKSYRPWAFYGQSKFANLLFAKELARRFAGTERTANALHPGVIKTNLARHMNPLAHVAFGVIGPVFLKSIPQGAATQTYVAVHPHAAAHSGKYFADCNIASPRRDAEDADMARKLWDVSEKIVSGL